MPSSTDPIQFFQAAASSTGQLITGTFPVWYWYAGIGIGVMALGIWYWTFIGAGRTSFPHRHRR